jgi:biofilm PGA synthesis N-glycosyltransferase PgaC
MSTNDTARSKIAYVLMTSAFNEERYIETTIRSVISQTSLPLRWVVVSDGSTDSTDAIIEKYRDAHDFITYVRLDHEAGEQQPEMGRVAWRKVNALAKAIGHFSSLQYDYICNIDADVSMENSFFERLLDKFCRNPRLGVSSGFVYNVIGDRLVPHFVNERNVCGALQFFRRECFFDIGGYVPYGHEDTIALIMARMRGWITRSFPDLRILHHKSAGCTGRPRYRAKYRLGTYDYIMSDCLAWELLRCAKECTDTPFIVGSCLRLTGYFKAMVRDKKVLPPAVQNFVRQEQYRLMKSYILGR